jgi:hypothetical protein
LPLCKDRKAERFVRFEVPSVQTAMSNISDDILFIMLVIQQVDICAAAEALNCIKVKRVKLFL